MSNLKFYEDKLFLNKFIKFSRKVNQRELLSDTLFCDLHECFGNAECTTNNKIVGSIKVVCGLFVLTTGVITYAIERTSSKRKLASIMECSTKQIAYSEGDFADRTGNPKKEIIGCASSLCTKNVKGVSLENLRVITSDLHMESLSEEYCDRLNSLEIIGGNLYLSKKNIDAYEQKRILPNLKYVGGKVLVHSREYKR